MNARPVVDGLTAIGSPDLSFPRHLLGIEGLTVAAVEAIFARAETHYQDASTGPVLRNRTILLAFFEASTRTRVSFELAARRLGAVTVALSPSTSSVTKGESLLDTVRNIEAMGAGLLVLRHAASGAARFVAERTSMTVVNAGDGLHEHPTQALVDAFTIRRRLGSIAGKNVAIVGDIAHSRVARSGALLLRLLGANVRFAGPATLLPARLGEAYDATVFDRVEPALEGADVVIVLRIQRERLGTALLPSLREYARCYGIDRRRLRATNAGALIMHPGPINHGVELEPGLAEAPESTVFEQVRAGVAVRAAVLAACSPA